MARLTISRKLRVNLLPDSSKHMPLGKIVGGYENGHWKSLLFHHSTRVKISPIYLAKINENIFNPEGKQSLV